MNVLFRKMFHPIFCRLVRASVPFRVVADKAPSFIPKHPIIFAANHSAYPDGPITCISVPRHSLVLAGKQRLDLKGKLMFFLNGTVFVDRRNKTDMAIAKERIIRYLRHGVSVIWFPEGTWNLTDSLPMLPLKWGIIDAAKKADAQIVPIILCYDRKNMVCRICWGAPIYGDTLLDQSAAIERLRDTMASLRWEDWCKGPLLNRAEINISSLQAERDEAKSEYPPIDLEYETSVIYRPYPSPEDVFSVVERLGPKQENAFLFRRDRSG